jgi:CheY-like chemotaxis protein
MLAFEEVGMKKKILLVDDHAGFAALLQRMMPECEVREANDSDVALRVAQEWCPDAFLLDLFMPGMRGDEFAARLAEIEALGQAPIFYLSALIETPSDGEPVMLDGHPAFGKPFNVDALRKHLALQMSGTEGAGAALRHLKPFTLPI